MYKRITPLNLSLIKKNNLTKKNQIYCFSVDKEIFGYQINKKVEPASITKIYTSFASLKKLGFDYRFKTNFYFIIFYKLNLFSV